MSHLSIHTMQNVHMHRTCKWLMPCVSSYSKFAALDKEVEMFAGVEETVCMRHRGTCTRKRRSCRM